MITKTLFIISFIFTANSSPPRILENDLVNVSLTRVERPVAEPSSKPFEIKLAIFCKKTKSTKTVNFPVCDFDLQDKDSNISASNISIAYFPWDGVKSNNPQGRIYCELKSKRFYILKITDVCK